MKFLPTILPGVYLIELVRIEDERGGFARTWCQREFSAQGLTSEWVQCNLSFNRRKGTLRGLHYQAFPHGETKLVRCVRGQMYDVVLDLRPESETFEQWTAVHLTAENDRMIYIPAGCAHGFQSLVDNTEVFYHMSNFYQPTAARGIRWNDVAFQIDWPMAPTAISEKDQQYAPYRRGLG